jgi:outer membrane PBP1 activator LpoA protein
MTVSTGIFAADLRQPESNKSAKSDSVYSYTAAEARQIAVLLAEGERCDSLLAVAQVQVALLDSIRVRYVLLEQNLSIVRRQADALVAELAEQNKALLAKNEKLRKKERCKKRLIGGSVLLNVVLMAIVLL